MLPSSPFHTTYTKSLELIFVDDVWPAPMVSTCGFKYLLKCVDAFSKYTWIFLFKLKSDVLLTFTHFLTAVEIQFSTKDKVVQTDGGEEFQSLTSLFLTKGIAHRLACPHTPPEWIS